MISIPGSRGTDWRIHAVYDPTATRLVRVQVTDFTGGERLNRDTYVPGEVVIADRGLAMPVAFMRWRTPRPLRSCGCTGKTSAS